MNQSNTVMFAIFIALGVLLVAGLVVISEQQALADKGGKPNSHASDKARGHCVGVECCGSLCGAALVQTAKVETVTV